MESITQPHQPTRHGLVHTFLQQGYLVTGRPLCAAQIADLLEALVADVSRDNPAAEDATGLSVVQ